MMSVSGGNSEKKKDQLNYLQKQGLSDLKLMGRNTFNYILNSIQLKVFVVTAILYWYHKIDNGPIFVHVSIKQHKHKYSLKDLILLNIFLNKIIIFLQNFSNKNNLKQNISEFIITYIIPLKKKDSQEIVDELDKMKISLLNDINPPEELELLKKLFPDDHLPETGIDSEILIKNLNQILKLDNNDKDFLELKNDYLPYSQEYALMGKLSGGIYHNDTALINLQSIVFKKFILGNQLHPDCFPMLRYLDAFLVKQSVTLYSSIGKENNPSYDISDLCGVTTSGGTESILLACLCARNYWYQMNPLLKTKNQKLKIVMPESAHAAFYKASSYFNMECCLLPLTKDYVANVNLLESYIKKNKGTVCLLVSSAPNFPYGTTDPFAMFNSMSLKYGIPWHIDCCLGSYLNPFLQDTSIKPSFATLNCWSLSTDLHKYGYSAKGVSVLLSRNKNYRAYQYYKQTNWNGGLYGSPTLAGSRPGALVAVAAFTMLHIGLDGYKKCGFEISDSVIELKKFVSNGITVKLENGTIIQNPLKILGDPKVCVVAFTFKDSDESCYFLGDILAKKFGYHLSPLQKPAALHYALTRLSCTKENIERFEKCLIESLKEYYEKKLEAKEKGELKQNDGDTAALYGVAGSTVTAGVAGKVIETFLDVLYE